MEKSFITSGPGLNFTDMFTGGVAGIFLHMLPVVLT